MRSQWRSSLNKKPRILLSTIHGVKGGESENVAPSYRFKFKHTTRVMTRNPDDENRLFYVGATRTKENHLHIVEPKDFYKSYPYMSVRIRKTDRWSPLSSNMKIQPESIYQMKNNLPFAEGNAIKYICRHKHKGGKFKI